MGLGCKKDEASLTAIPANEDSAVSIGNGVDVKELAPDARKGHYEY